MRERSFMQPKGKAMQSDLSATPQLIAEFDMAESAARINLRKQPRIAETIIQAFLFLCGAISVLTTNGIIYVLGQEAWLFFSRPEVGAVDFFTKIKWQPAILEF